MNKKLKNKGLAFVSACGFFFLNPTFAESIRDKPHFEFTAFTSNANVNTPNEVWDFSSLYLFRKEDQITYGGIINYASRLDQNAIQGFLKAIPKINNRLWLELGYGYAEKPQLFPDHTLELEAYGKLTDTVIVSGGNAYKKITTTYFNTYTLSIAKYIGHYYFSFRPYHYVPKSGPNSTLFQLEAKKFWDNPDKYIGILYATGTSPDLFDLVTVNFFKVNNNILFINGQQPINDRWAFKYGVGYETQKFPNDFLRRLAYLNIGIRARMA